MGPSPAPRRETREGPHNHTILIRPTHLNPFLPTFGPSGFSLSGGFAGRRMVAPQAQAQAQARARSGEVTMRLFDQKRREIKFIEDIAGLRE